jgi:predicted O-methyltransferase YrrM
MKIAHPYISNVTARVVPWAGRAVPGGTRADSNVSIALAALIHDEVPKAFDALAFVDFLRQCIEPVSCQVVMLRANGTLDDPHGLRFQTLLESIRTNLPRVPTALAIEIAHAADALRSMRTPYDTERWSGDVGLHFAISSSMGRKGRLLSSIVRFCRPARCLELGTAYGMSARFILGTQTEGRSLHLTTVECVQATHALVSPQLTARYGAAVDCRLGWTRDVLPELAKSISPIDFVFHDAGHTMDDYIRDFSLIVDALAPGAVLLIDDIRWEDARFYPGPTNTYRGWQAVAGHERIRHAVEIDGSIGMALVA